MYILKICCQFEAQISLSPLWSFIKSFLNQQHIKEFMNKGHGQRSVAQKSTAPEGEGASCDLGACTQYIYKPAGLSSPPTLFDLPEAFFPPSCDR